MSEPVPTLEIRSFEERDTGLGLRLSSQAGWNQTLTDWNRFARLAAPEASFVAEHAGEPVGTTVSFIFGDTAWIGLVLVDEAHRGRGIGTELVRRAIAALEDRVARIRLDATALGRPIYETLGFRAQYEVARLRGLARCAHSADESIEEISPDQLEEVAALDRAVVRADRSQFLRVLLEDPTVTAIGRRRESGRLEGYAVLRPGREASLIGPCLAATKGAGEALLDEAMHRAGSSACFTDLALPNEAARASLSARDFTEVRRFVRMQRGPGVAEKLDQLWASSGPEKG